MSSRYITAEMRDLVAVRANFVCEYCLTREQDTYFNCQVEHIISIKHGGASEPTNLAYACIFCNRFKGSDIGSISKQSRQLVRFYNPRIDRWREHFSIEKALVLPQSEIGEVTERILRMNSDERILEREILFRQGRYPSDEARLLIAI